jgi:Metallo-beta-lactamase superfamily
MDATNGLKETTRVTAPVASNTLSVNVFTAPGKAMVGERPKPFGEAFGFDPITSTLIFGEHDAVLVDAMTTVPGAEALAHWVALHNRNLETIYITHAHFDHFYGLSILLDRFPEARAIATPKTVKAITQIYLSPPVKQLARRMFPGQIPTKLIAPEPYEPETFTLEGPGTAHHRAGSHRLSRFDVAICSVDRPRRRRRRCVQPMPHVRRRHHSREPKKLDRGAGPVSSAEPDDGRRRPQEAWRARLSLDNQGH